MNRKGQPMSQKTIQPDRERSRDDFGGMGGFGPSASGAISKEEFETIASFRYAIRKFLRFTETAVRREHITPQQHQLLLALKGFPDRDYARVSELAERLQMRQHSMVGLIDRTEAQGLVRREQSTTDRRQVFIYLTPAGEGVLYRLAMQHRRELATMRDALRVP